MLLVYWARKVEVGYAKAFLDRLLSISGLAQKLGIEKNIAIRLHTYGKAMASTGGERASPRPDQSLKADLFEQP